MKVRTTHSAFMMCMKRISQFVHYHTHIFPLSQNKTQNIELTRWKASSKELEIPQGGQRGQELWEHTYGPVCLLKCVA